MDQIMQLWSENQGIITLIAFLLGGGAALPFLKKFAAVTPNKIDDAACAVLERILLAKQQDFSTLAMSELESRLTDDQVREIARLRKARWAAAKAQVDLPMPAK